MFLRNLVYRLGSDPKKSWTTFKLGLLIFVIGAALILLGTQYSPLLQLPGLIALAVGLIIAAKGYLGIFSNRFAKTLERLDAASTLNSKNKHRD
ncbi:hypothetical protein EYS14_16830 [Alteromonadaceae bacterium M269]|nr:hypothetical protein EYS14_16830 [Alteromonadaceae bacterium M269]